MIETTTLRLVGEPNTPLIMHNGRLADRDYEWARELGALTKKRNKTDEDHEEVARLEWRGGLYLDDNVGPYLPGDNIRRSLIDGARLTKEGKTIERGVLRLSRINRLGYDGPRTPEEMWEAGRFKHRAMVRVGQSKVARYRPKFVDWTAEVVIDFDSSIIERRDLVRIAGAAGAYIGVCDGRPFYGGRFAVDEVTS